MQAKSEVTTKTRQSEQAAIGALEKCGKVMSACLGHVASASGNIGGFHPHPNDRQFTISTQIRPKGKTQNTGLVWTY